MHIRATRIKGHPGIGDLSLNFQDSGGSAFPIIVLAGGNGTGKSAVLEVILNFFAGTLHGQSGEVEIDFTISDQEFQRLDKALSQYGQYFRTQTLDITIKYLQVDPTTWGYFADMPDPLGMGINRLGFPMSDGNIQQFFSIFYSEANVSFFVSHPQSITGNSLDVPRSGPLRAGQKLATEIAQLLVDIRAADAEDLQNWVIENPGKVPEPNEIGKRMERFRRAFEYMFPTKRFKAVQRANKALRIDFEEFGRTSSIDKLSSGEKQIVFRAGFFLRDLAASKNALIMIDEPELSLHPEWQSRVIGFYTSLLSDEDGQHPQIIVTTHSPFIVHGSANAKVVILEKDSQTGIISEASVPAYPVVSGTEAIRAFNIDGFLAAAQKPLLVLVEGDTDSELISTAWDKLYPSKQRMFELRSALGAKNVNISLNDQELFVKLQSRKIVGIFDFDSAFDHWNGVWHKSGLDVCTDESKCLVRRHPSNDGWALLLPVPHKRAGFASRALGGKSILSIEFLFDDANHLPGMIGQRPIPPSAVQPYMIEGYKRAFAAHAKGLPASAFADFSELFERLEDCLHGRL